MYHNLRCPVCGSNYVEVQWQEHTGHVQLRCHCCRASGGVGLTVRDVLTAWRTETRNATQLPEATDAA